MIKRQNILILIAFLFIFQCNNDNNNYQIYLNFIKNNLDHFQQIIEPKSAYNNKKKHYIKNNNNQIVFINSEKNNPLIRIKIILKINYEYNLDEIEIFIYSPNNLLVKKMKYNGAHLKTAFKRTEPNNKTTIKKFQELEKWIYFYNKKNINIKELR